MSLLSKKLTISASIVLFAVVFSLPAFAQQTYSPPQTVNEIENAIETVEDRIEQLEEEIEEYRGEVVKIGAQKNTLKNKLNQIETERKKILTDVELTDEKISHTQLSLAEIREGIELTEKDIETHRGVIGESLRQLYESEGMSLIEMMLSDARLSDIFRERSMTRSLRAGLDERVVDLRFLRADLNERKKEFLTEQEELQELKDQILDQKSAVDETRREQTALLRETQYEESRYQNLIAEREALRKAFEQELFEYESKLTFLLDPDLLPARGSAPLVFPLDKIVVTQLFGAKTGPHRTYANGHSGTDFRANSDPVYAMADGVVLGVGDTDQACRAASFGKWVLVDFDNNLAATYAHLSIISVSAGQRVSRGQIIGYSGNTGRSTAPHLHISLYAAIDAEGKNPVRIEGKESRACKGATLVQPRAPIDAYLDILDYLPPLEDANFKAGVRG